MLKDTDDINTDIPPSHFLLVEDNPDDQALALRAFKKNDFDSIVTVASDGVEALDYLLGDNRDATSPLPTLILLDLKLPRLDGHEVLRRLRADERTRHLPVVVMTCSSEQEDILKSYELGANSYIRKPVNVSQFDSMIAHLGNYWLRINQPPYA